MKIFLETKDANNHRIVFCSDNGKPLHSGEWVRRKGNAMTTLYNSFSELVNVEYVAFLKNSGPKKSTSKKKK